MSSFGRISLLAFGILAGSLSVAGCGEGKFTGNTPVVAKRDGTTPGGTNPDGTTPGGGDTPGSTPGTGGPGDPNGPGTPGDPNGPGTPGSPNGPGTPGTPGTPGSSPDDIPGTDAPGVNWGEIIQSILRPRPFVEGNDNPITFVPDNGAVFHIGDNAMDASTCLGQLTVTPLVGTMFFFEFEVPEGGTQVNVEVIDVCGVDYSTTNRATLVRDGEATPSQERILPQGRGPNGRVDIALGRVTLPAGKYTLKVESTPNTRVITQRTPNGDRDDFIIGKVKVHANKPIVRGNVRAGF